MLGYKNQSVEISCKLDDGNISQYPYVVIKDINGSTETTLSLSHLYSGQYTSNSWTPTETGYYNANYSVYSDAGHTTLNTNYNQGMETIWIIEELPTSSQVTSSTYGGGGRGAVSVVAGRKSPWTHEQRDKVIEATKDTKQLVEKLTRDVEKYHEKEVKLIDKLIEQLKALQKRLVKADTKEDAEQIREDINVISKMLATIMPDEAIEKLGKELK